MTGANSGVSTERLTDTLKVQLRFWSKTHIGHLNKVPAPRRHCT